MGMNSQLSLEDRIVDVRTRLYSYLRHHNLRDVVRERGAWTVGLGRVVVNALLAGLGLSSIRKLAMMRNIVDDQTH